MRTGHQRRAPAAADQNLNLCLHGLPHRLWRLPQPAKATKEEETPPPAHQGSGPSHQGGGVGSLTDAAKRAKAGCCLRRTATVRGAWRLMCASPRTLPPAAADRPYGLLAVHLGSQLSCQPQHKPGLQLMCNRCKHAVNSMPFCSQQCSGATHCLHAGAVGRRQRQVAGSMLGRPLCLPWTP